MALFRIFKETQVGHRSVAAHRFRRLLMNDFNPTHYRFFLTPDLDGFKFSARVEIAGELLEAQATVTLNILELAIWRCIARLDGKEVICPFSVDPRKEELHIQLPRDISGRLTLIVEYEGQINDRMAGFYRSRYRKDGQTRYIAVTQFEESDARRALPCVDHPFKKATFTVEMIVDAGLVAISNTLIDTEEHLANGKKRVTFQRTPKMSTYLLFFGVGEFEFVVNSEDPRVRVATTPGMTPYTGYGLEFGRQALAYCEDYYRIPYPLPKMDLIAIPDFAFGAMENWGAITFRENLLLHYPDSTSRAGEERICEVIAHEIAHQWFGNLVTPSDWRYLWLNESFATFFGFGVVDNYYPEWGIWEQFIGSQTEGALVRDGLHETFAIEIPGGEHVVINTSTAPIIYSKGGSILRQVLGFIGPELFRDGLHRYLEAHAYANAASSQLWEAFESSSEVPVTRMMKSWIEQPGYPLITVERQGDQLSLRQHRFTYLPNTSGQLWDVPITARLIDRNGEERIVRHLMTGETAVIELAPGTAAYKINADQTGFYRVQYLTPEDFETLGERVRNKSLSTEDRWGLQNDLYAGVRSGNIGIDTYLAFLEYYRAEDAFLPLSSIAANLFQAYGVLTGDSKNRLKPIGRTLLEEALAAIGLTPHAAEPFTVSLLRDQIMLPAAILGGQDVIQFAEKQFDNLLTGGTVHPDILKSTLQIGALTGGNTALKWLQQRFQSTISEHERLNILAALGWFSDKRVIESALQFALAEVPDRNKFIPIVAASANPHAVDHLWDWYLSHLSELEAFHPLLYERVIAAIVPAAGIGRPESVGDFFKKYVADHPQTGDVVRLAMEHLEINLRMRKRSSS
jgi:tricorn protease interacting factor F2/3